MFVVLDTDVASFTHSAVCPGRSPTALLARVELSRPLPVDGTAHPTTYTTVTI
jgi:hypothetical protein